MIKIVQGLVALILLGVHGVVVAAAASDSVIPASMSAQDYDFYSGDFNGDGYMDLLYIAKDPSHLSGIILSDGTGLNIPLQSWGNAYLGIPWSSGTYTVIVADFNGDGKADILLQRNTPGDSYLLLTGESGVVAISQTIANTTAGVAWSADQHHIVAGDFNNDGKADLFLQATNSSGLSAIILADSHGQFTAKAPAQSWNDGYLGFKWATSEASVFAGDFNGDGYSDLLIQAKPLSGTGPGTSRQAVFPTNMNGVVLAQQGAQLFTADGVQSWSRDGFSADWSPLDSVIVIGDFNGDGRADVILQGITDGNPSYLLYGKSPGAIFATSIPISSSIVPTADRFRLLAGHFDNSQGASLLLQGQTRSQSNYFAHIKGGTLVATAQISSARVAMANAPGGAAPIATGVARMAALAVTSAGRTASQFSITPSGAATDNIPLWVPPGAREIEPHLALHYMSGGPDGIMGPGWGLKGVSAIARCGKTWASNGSNAGVTLATSDDLCLDGNRLRLTSGTQGMGGSTYLAELADFSLITAGGSSGSPLTYFTVQGKDGRYYEYGNTADSKITAAGAAAPYEWALDKVSDRQANNMVFAYASGSAATISTIQYTATPGSGSSYGYKVAFNYVARTGGTVITKYVAGRAVTQANELTNINVTSAGTSVRQYNLTYSASPTTARPMLATIQECGGSTGADCIRPTTITYQAGGAGFSTTASSTGLTAQYGFIPVDLNGDGIPDVLYGKISGSNIHWYAKIATLTGYGAEIDTGANTPLTGAAPLVGAFAGKGAQQFLAPVGSTLFVYSFSGTSFFSVSTGASSGVQLVADYDGDGLPDLVTYNGTNIVVQRNLTTPGTAVTFGPATVIYNGTVGATYFLRGVLADFNGDGRQDLIATRTTNKGAEHDFALISNGIGALATVVDYGGTGAVPQIGDLNGDGCSDIFTATTIWISNCAGGFTSIATAVPGGGSAYVQILALDYDGDGQTDFLYGDFTSNTWMVQKSTGTGLSAPVTTSISAAWNSGSTQSKTFFAIDRNSDGQLELAYIDSLNSYAVGYYPHTASNTPPDLATAFTDGFGIFFNPTYVPISSYNNYTKGSSAIFPDEDFSGPLYVANQFTASDGSGSTYQLSYSYTGARLNLQGRGFEGFATTQSLDSRNGVFHKVTYRQDFPFAGMPSEDDLYQPDGTTLMSKTTDGYAQNELVSNTSGYSSPGSACSPGCFAYASSTSVYHYEVGGAKNGILVATDVTNFTYDAFGSLTTTASTSTDNDSASPSPSPFNGLSWTNAISNTIVNDTTNWCLGRPSQTQTTKTAAGQPALTRAVSHTIDSVNCRATQEVIEPGNARLQVTTNFGFAPTGCGNTTSVSVVGLDQNGMAMPARTTTTSYGTRCQLPETVTNALNQTTTTGYRYDLGLRSSVTDPNGIIASWLYDDFGRKTNEARPDGTSTSWTYADCVTAPCWGVSDLRFVTTETLLNSAGSAIRVHDIFADGMDRLRYDEGNRLLGVWNNVVMYYDQLGRKTEVTLPFSSTSNGYHIITYDLANRATADQLYTSSGILYRTVATTYLGQTATITDPLNNVTTKVTDVSGKLRWVTDPAIAPNPAATTKYTFDSLSNLVTIVDPIGVTSTYSYNIRGFKTGAIDADTGTWVFTPDSLNELVSQKDAKAQTTTFGYDLLGRMTSRLEPESSTPTTWLYGTSATLHNIGQLYSLSKPDGYAEQNDYDSQGRLQTKIYTEDGTNYQFDYAYNTNGTIDTQTYPISTSGVRFQLKFIYDSAGYLNQTKDASTGTLFWTLSTANDSNAPTLELLANGVQIATGYTPWTNEMVTRSEGSAGSTTNLQNLSYSWDLIGNLHQRVDNRQFLTEVFSVDALNRLNKVTLNSTQTLSVTYDVAGDILTKSDVGSYTYGSPAHPHAVTDAGSWTIGYDANGNMSTRAGGAISSYSYNLPNQINYSGSSSQFNYDANHQRWKQVANYSGTVETVHYVGGLLQVVARAGVTEYRHQIPAGSGTAIYKRSSNGTNSTYYATSDHLGSADLVLDSSANVLVRESFGPFGARRGSNWQGLPTTGDYSAMDTTTRQGFTGHEMLDTVGLVHMNGRVYDPTLGRFLSADTVVQSLGATQSINPYSYAWNDPLTYTDPSGHSLIGAIVGIVAAIIAIWFMQPELFGALGGTLGIETAAVAGFVGGFIGTLVSTGNLEAAFTAGIMGTITAVLFYGAGSFAQQFAGTEWQIPMGVLSHAAVGCVSGTMSSGNCGKGAISAAVSEVADQAGLMKPASVGSWGIEGTAEAGLVGGIAARAVGGSFSDGFTLGAAGYIFTTAAAHLGEGGGLSANTGHEAGGDFTRISPAAIAALRADPMSGLSEAEWAAEAASAATGNETAIAFYKSSDGRSYYAVYFMGDSPTHVAIPDLPDPGNLVLLEHTHPVEFCTMCTITGGVAQGPSYGDSMIANKYPNTYMGIIEANPYSHTYDIIYYGPKVGIPWSPSN